MLVICEDCAKKYNIDESRIKGNRARFTCNECGHIIIVDKADLNRSLFSSMSASGSSPTSSSSIDLLKEMEVPITDNTEKETESMAQEFSKTYDRRKPQWKFRGIPVFVFFISGMIFALIFISLVTGYLYTEYLYSEYMADVLNKKFELRQQLMIRSSLIFGGAWLFVLIFFTIFGRYIHAKLAILVKNANQLAKGEYDIEIARTGPREVRDLAFALERIREQLTSQTGGQR